MSQNVLSKKSKGGAVFMTLMECQTRFYLTCRSANKQAQSINKAVGGKAKNKA